MTLPFNYPDTPHERRHGPQGYADYDSYRPWLRDEFTFRCVYCLTREVWGPVTGMYALDHFVPVAIRPELVGEYDNLFYCCTTCNGSKGKRVTPDPAAVLTSPSVTVAENGRLEARTLEANRVIELVGLNAPRMCEFRELWMRIIRLALVAEPDLHRRLLGFPDDLPDLKRLRPPGGNKRPAGLTACHLARRQAGTLPEAY